ncbi:MAG: hypothetical protein WAU82_07845 [Candidatus Binatus sp.]|uniref:hypothetical protein n=1 Tax=Candidatus Binatus sp. TaxID=2811406 RepID=UPI003BC659B9
MPTRKCIAVDAGTPGVELPSAVVSIGFEPRVALKMTALSPYAFFACVRTESNDAVVPVGVSEVGAQAAAIGRDGIGTSSPSLPVGASAITPSSIRSR